MATELEEQLRRENTLLRAQIARLLGQKIDLQRQLADLSRERAQTGVDAIIAALGQSVRDADAALAVEAAGGTRFTVSDVEATFRGTIVGSPAGVALRLPIPEYGVLPGHLGSIRFAMNVVPPPVASPAPSLPVRPSPDERLRGTLERVQETFSNRRGAGQAAAEDVVARTIRLLSSEETRNSAVKFGTELNEMATALTRSAKALAMRASGDAARHREAANALKNVLRDVRASRSVSDADKDRVSAILDTLGGSPQ